MNNKNEFNQPRQLEDLWEYLQDVYQRPLMVVSMPLNKDGQGPEMDKTKVVETKYQVWDSLHVTIAEFNTKDEAIDFTQQCNMTQLNIDIIQQG